MPRITRYRLGASRFTVMDPSGNSVVFIQRDESVELEFKTDDRAAFRALNSGLRRHGDSAPAAEQAVALDMLIELSTALDEPAMLEPWLPDAT